MRSFLNFLGISFRDFITSEEVKTRTENAIGPLEDHLTSVKRRRLRWYKHVTRSSGLAKTILQGIVQGARRRNRQKNDGKIISESGLALNGTSYCRKLRTVRIGEVEWL